MAGSERIFVVEAEDNAFDLWKDKENGVAAHVDAMGGDGNKVQIVRLSSASDLVYLAHEIKTSKHLPARALVLADTGWGNDLTHDPYDQGIGINSPADHDEETDPAFTSRVDQGRPLDPYGRHIASRLVKRVVPNVADTLDASYSWEWPKGKAEQDDTVNANPDLYEWAHGITDSSVPRPRYGGFLARVNTTLALSGEPFMSIADFTNTQSRSILYRHLAWTGRGRDYRTDYYSTRPVEGADIVDASAQIFRNSAMKTVAGLVMGQYPGVVEGMDAPAIPQKVIIDLTQSAEK